MKWNLRCRDAAALLTQRQDRALPRLQALALRWHVWICPPCAQFAQQLRFMHGAMGAWRRYRADDDGPAS